MRVLDWSTLAEPSQAARYRWRYALLVENIEVDGFHCESYGIAVTDNITGLKSQCRHVSVNAKDALELLALLARNHVTPSTLNDVVEDWLGR